MTKQEYKNEVAYINGVVTLEENGEYKCEYDSRGDGAVILSILAHLIIGLGEANSFSYEKVLKDLETIIKVSECLRHD